MKFYYNLLFLSAFSLQAKDCCFCAFSMAVRAINQHDRPATHTISRDDGSVFDIYLCAPRDADHLNDNPNLIGQITDKQISDSLKCKNKPRVIQKDFAEQETRDIRYVYNDPYYVRYPYGYGYYPYGYYGRPGVVGGILDAIF
jgi:hypothetical protein